MWVWSAQELTPPISHPTVVMCWMLCLTGAWGMSSSAKPHSLGSCENGEKLSLTCNNSDLAGSVQIVALAFAIPTPNVSTPFLSEEETISKLKPSIILPYCP